MTTVYLGTSEFAAAVLRRLSASGRVPALVITRPDRPRGRGRRVAAPPVADAARELGIDVIQPDTVNSDEARSRIAAVEPEAVCVCAFGALIKEPLLSEHPMLNVHPSLLPRWRGAAPIERAIDAGDERTGVSIMRPTPELDAGPVCIQRSEPIRADDDFGSLSARLEELSGDLLVEALDCQPRFEEQPDEGVTFAEKIGPDDRRLSPGRSAVELERRTRALRPHIGAYVDLPGGERLGVVRASAAGRVTDLPEPGRLEAAAGGELLFGCRGGALDLLEVKPAGGRAMDSGAYVRGYAGRLDRAG